MRYTKTFYGEYQINKLDVIREDSKIIAKVELKTLVNNVNVKSNPTKNLIVDLNKVKNSSEITSVEFYYKARDVKKIKIAEYVIEDGSVNVYI